jgi:hypothetical protein
LFKYTACMPNSYVQLRPLKSAYGSKNSCVSQKPSSSSAYSPYVYKRYVPYRSSFPRRESPYRSKSSTLCRSHFHHPWTILTGPKVLCLTEANLIRVQYLLIKRPVSGKVNANRNEFRITANTLYIHAHLITRSS